jgi:hypothetical protein
MNEHVSIDGTVVEAAASLKSFRQGDGDPLGPPDECDAREHDRPRGASDAQGQAKEAKLMCMARALMEDENGSLADRQRTEADEYAVRETAIDMID